MSSTSTRVGQPPRSLDATERRHVVLVGYAGSGKTVVGRALAERIGCDFVDLDDVIVEAAGTSLRDIFRRHGDVGFRARERAALREILARKNVAVVATGGATFVDPAMRGWIHEAGRSVYLQASPESLLARLDGGDQRAHRPLVGGPDLEQTIRRTLSERVPAYEEADYTVRTDLSRVEHVVEEIVRLLRLDRLGASGRAPARRRFETPGAEEPEVGETPPVQVRLPAGSYPVHFRAAAGSWLAHEISRSSSGPRVVVIADEAVAALHATPLVNGLRDSGKSVSLQVVPPGEESKVLSMAAMLYGRLLEQGIDRHDLVVALGGGVICDLAGFVASTFLRGIPHVQVPTTTLAAVDATIGGKTALHAPFGRNLIGTTYPPKAVLVAGTHLASQPRREHVAGLVEVLKLAVTLDAPLFDTLTREAEHLARCVDPTLTVLRRAVALKAELLARADFVTGERTVLSFGHTVGEAIEAAEGSRLLHGEAVGLGMLAETEWAEAEGWCAGSGAALAQALRALGLPVDWRGRALDERGIGLETKRRGGHLRLAFVPRVGSHEVRTVPAAALVEFLRRRGTTG